MLPRHLVSLAKMCKTVSQTRTSWIWVSSIETRPSSRRTEKLPRRSRSEILSAYLIALVFLKKSGRLRRLCLSSSKRKPRRRERRSCSNRSTRRSSSLRSGRWFDRWKASGQSSTNLIVWAVRSDRAWKRTWRRCKTSWIISITSRSRKSIFPYSLRKTMRRASSAGRKLCRKCLNLLQ